ncbi:uncharacterized protein [Chelonus insularis]|uniref:uncharacterized protein n=1 Tax=Chelonus insularis TaxID=460826 RepID=UPI00158BD277|nr:uncharacterized protein LOC118066166 [Chelonus insularis]
MEQVIYISWSNKILLITSIICAILCLIIEQWSGLTPFSIYISLIWCVIIIAGSTWCSCYLLKVSLKANSPINLEFLKNLIYKRLDIESTAISTHSDKIQNDVKANNYVNNNQNNAAIYEQNFINLNSRLDALLNNTIDKIDEKFIHSWYNVVSDEKIFVDESNEILKKLFKKIYAKITVIDGTKLSHKVADILLLHFKEYRRALRRVEKEKAKNLEEAYRYSHPGSRNPSALEHTLHRLVTILLSEFLQWELSSSLPCKLLISVLAKKLLVILQDISSPHWILLQVVNLLESSKEKLKSEDTNNDIVSQGLSTGLTSATAAVITRPLPQLPQSVSNTPPIVEITVPKEAIKSKTTDRVSLCLDGLSTIDHNGLWNDLNDIQLGDEDDDDRISPVYEEPTDFATTIARLRNVLQEKSTTTSPLPVEEKFYTLCDNNQFVNLAIPWTEFTTSADGSQQLLYCIQFDDVEQHGEDMFETTTATVRRQYADFVQLHKSLEELPNYTIIMSNIHLPEGGRVEMETYLKTLCSRLSPHTPTQLRHFLRPSSGASKKADAVAPRFDRFLAKTVTGVFNTLRTVVPGFEMDQEEDSVPVSTLMPLSDIPWRFVEDIKTKNITHELRTLISDRIDYCSIDTAYEAVESVEGSGDTELLSHWWKTRNTLDDEELDELDSKLTMTCAFIDLICEILEGVESNNTLRRETVVRWTKLFIGNITEPLIHKYTSQLFQHIDKFSIFSQSINDEQKDSIEVLQKKLSNLINSKITMDIKFIFGENDINRIIEFLIGSLRIKKINHDLMLQILDIFALELLAVSKNDLTDSVT